MNRDLRPLDIRVIDFETSDLPENEGVIIEIGYTDLRVHRVSGASHVEWLTRSFGGALYGSARFGLPEGKTIAHDAKATHGIWENELPHEVLSPSELHSFLQCEQATTRRFDYLVAHNAEFERKMFARYGHGQGGAYPRPPFICTMKVSKRVWPRAEKHTLGHLRYHANLERGKRDPRCDPMHAAGPDTWLTAMLFADMLMNYHVPVEEMRQYTVAPEFHAFCPIGKYKGKEWADVDKGYLAWILRTEDMEEGIKAAARIELNSRSTSRW